MKLPWKRKGRKPAAPDEPAVGTPLNKKKRRGTLKKVIVPLCIAAVAAGVLFVRPWAGTKAGAAEQTFAEEQATQRDVTLTLSSTGTVAPANQYNVTAGVKGNVLSSTFEEGDTVQKGQTLYEIDKTEVQNTIDRAKLSLQKSQNSYREAQEGLSDLSVQSDVGGTFTYLSESTITSGASGKISELSIREGTQVAKSQTVVKLTSTSLQNQVKSSRLSLQDAQLSYENTLDQLKDYTITAPISGTVITKNTKVGDTLDTTSGQATLAVTDLILNDFTGDLYSYGVMLIPDEKDSGGQLSATYTYQIGDEKKTSSMTGGVLGATRGPTRFTIENGQLTSAKKLDAVRAPDSISGLAVQKDGETHRFADDCVAYLYANDTYTSVPLNEVVANTAGYTVTAYYDKDDARGGRVRVLTISKSVG